MRFVSLVALVGMLGAPAFAQPGADIPPQSSQGLPPAGSMQPIPPGGMQIPMQPIPPGGMQPQTQPMGGQQQMTMQPVPSEPAELFARRPSDERLFLTPTELTMRPASLSLSDDVGVTVRAALGVPNRLQLDMRI